MRLYLARSNREKRLTQRFCVAFAFFDSGQNTTIHLQLSFLSVSAFRQRYDWVFFASHGQKKGLYYFPLRNSQKSSEMLGQISRHKQGNAQPALSTVTINRVHLFSRRGTFFAARLITICEDIWQLSLKRQKSCQEIWRSSSALIALLLKDFFDLRTALRDRITSFDGRKSVIEFSWFLADDEQSARFHTVFTSLFERKCMASSHSKWQENEHCRTHFFNTYRPLTSRLRVPRLRTRRARMLIHNKFETVTPY